MTCRWRAVGELLRMGALLWKCPEESKGGKQKQIDATDVMRYPALSKDLMYSLMNNYKYEEYERLSESHVPEWMEEPGPLPALDMKPEDYLWMTVTEKDIDDVLRGEEGNLRDEDIDGIINAESKMNDAGDTILDSFKAFLSSTSNVEGIDSIPGANNDALHVDFDAVCDLLMGGNEWTVSCIGCETSSDEEDEGVEAYPEGDADFDALSNLLKSYSLQSTTDGPVSSMMTSMGMQLPPTEYSDSEDGP